MEKMRICDCAKKINVKSSELIKFFNKKYSAGLNPKGYSKTIDKKWCNEASKHFETKNLKKKKNEKEDVPEEEKAPKRLIRRIIRKKKPVKDKIKKDIKLEDDEKKTEEVVKEKVEEKPIEKEIEHIVKEQIKKTEEKPKIKVEEKKTKEKTEEKKEKEKVIDVKKPVEKDEKKKKIEDDKEKKKQKYWKKPKYNKTKYEEVATITNESKSITSEEIDLLDDKKKKKKKKKKKSINKQEVAKSVEETIKSIKIDKTAGKKRYKDKIKKEDADDELEIKTIMIAEHIILSDLADKIEEDPIDLIKKAIEMGIMVTINQRLDYDNASIIAMEFGYEVQKIEESNRIKTIQEEEKEIEEGLPRTPVVTIMGHVDHGKTTLIDFLRESGIVETEYGNITQNIGAYTVSSKIGKITVIDTPGHEAFTSMRARGAQVTDIAVIVIAANDSVKPQTREAINHAMLANIPYIIAINKIDLPEADIDLVKRDLLNENIVVEDYGGKIPVVCISAKTGENVDELIETIILQAELMELKAPIDGEIKATVIEVKQDKGLGPIINCIVQKGTLNKGDIIVSGNTYGKVRKMLDEYGEDINEAGPSLPVVIVGLNELPEVGDIVKTVDNLKKAKDIARQRYLAYREQLIKKRAITNVDSYERQLKDMKKKELNLIMKGSNFGSIEALADSLQVLSNEEVKISVVYKEVGIVTENDINIAIASQSAIIAFDTSVSNEAKKFAKKENIIIKQYNIIYDVIDDIQKAILSLNDPVYETIETGKAEVRNIFKFSKTGIIAGLYVIDGFINRNSKIKVLRKQEELGIYEIKSLKRFQDDVKKVETGYECALILDGFEDIQKEDIFVAFEEKLIEPEL